MGILSKAWKGLKKGVKKIGKGIKKAFGKVAKVFGKLGIVGQLALGFLMPYALGAMSNFASAALSKVGTWSSTLIKSSSVFSKAVGYGLKAVHKVGTTLGNMYTSVTDTISAGIDKTKEFFGAGPTDSIDITKDLNSNVQASIDADVTKTLNTTTGDVPFNTSTPKPLLAKSKVMTASEAVVSAGTTTPSVVGGETLLSKVSEEATTNILQDIGTGIKKFAGDINITNPESQIRQDIADFSAYDYGKSAVTGAVDSAVMGGMQDAGRQKVASALGYKVPNSNQTYINLPEMQGSRTNIGKYNEASLWAQSNGNNFITQSFRPRDYVAEAFGTSNEVQDYFNALKPIQPIGVA
jgi:hypothetical protein